MNRDEVLKLIRKKEDIEREINQLGDILESQGNIGMHGPLVDAEGYPRIDIDILQVRIARQKIICLQNDYKAIMKEIEKCLHEIHANSVGGDSTIASSSANSDQIMSDIDPQNIPKPIARVGTVMHNSPGELAGLAEGDLILQFGSVSAQNCRGLEDISNVVQHSIAKSVPVMVKRNENYYHLSLTPNKWTGRGLLGCNLMPL